MSLPDLPQVPRERRGTATVVALAGLGSLCLLGLVLGLKGLTAPGGDTPAAASTPAPSLVPAVSPAAVPPSSSVRPPAPQAATDHVRFTSPSGNIRCLISSIGARCGIADRSWRPPVRPPSCTGTWGHDLTVTARGATLVCTTGRVPRGSALSYGRQISRGAFRCASTPDGINCTNGTGRGFRVSRGSVSIR